MDETRITVVEAVERHLYQAYSVLAQAFHPEWVRERRFTYFLSERRMPALCNGVLQFQASSEETPALIEEILQRAGNRSLTWLVGPSTQPEDLPQRLMERGFLPDETVIGMYLPLHGLAKVTEIPVPKGLVIIPVKTREQMLTWIQVLARGFGLPDPATHLFEDLVSAFEPRHFQRFYLGLVDGIAVATSLLCLDATIAGVYGVSTLPEMRLRGYGSAMTHHALTNAQRSGYYQATLQATRMGESIYRRLRFEKVCTFQTYRFEPHE